MGTVAAISQPNLSVEALLGGRRVLRAKPSSSLDWVAVIRRGISSAAVDSITKSIRVTQAELATAFGKATGFAVH